LNQALQIQQAVLRSLHSRDLYTERQVNSMLNVLRTAEVHVKAKLVEIGEKKLLKKGLEIRSEQLQDIQRGIDEIIKDLKSNQTLIIKNALRILIRTVLPVASGSSVNSSSRTTRICLTKTA